MKPRPLTTGEVEALEESLSNLNRALHEQLLATGLVTVGQWNEHIAPRLKGVADVLLGTPIHARSYRAHESIYPDRRDA